MTGLARDLSDMVFGNWLTIRRAGTTRKGGAAWLCRCSCGVEKTVPAESLVRGKSKSCGCKSNVMRRALSTVHGHTRFRGKPSGAYSSWAAMIQRCNNANSSQFADYGGRGIVVCDRWADFVNFLADMGERPLGLSLDRIDNSRGYEPGNCRWASRAEQARNQRARLRHGDMDDILAAARAVCSADAASLPFAVAALRSAMGRP